MRRQMECAGYALVGETVPLTFIVTARDAVASAALSVKVCIRPFAGSLFVSTVHRQLRSHASTLRNRFCRGPDALASMSRACSHAHRHNAQGICCKTTRKALTCVRPCPSGPVP